MTTDTAAPPESLPLPAEPLALSAEPLRPPAEWHALPAEPFSSVGASAHLTAVCGTQHGWYHRRWRRRLGAVLWLLRTSAAKLTGTTTGVRMVLRARRVKAAES